MTLSHGDGVFHNLAYACTLMVPRPSAVENSLPLAHFQAFKNG